MLLKNIFLKPSLLVLIQFLNYGLSCFRLIQKAIIAQKNGVNKLNLRPFVKKQPFLVTGNSQPTTRNSQLAIRIPQLIILFLLSAISGFAQNDIIDNEVSISGKIIDLDTSQNLTFRFYKDYLTFEEINYSAILKNDSFFIKIPIKESSPGFIALGEINVPIFLEKGDHFFVHSTVKSFADSLRYVGIGAMANNYLKQTFLIFDSKDTKRIEAGIAKKTAKGFQDLMQQFKQEKIDFLDTFLFKRDTQFTKSFDEYVQSDINYWYGYNLMRYRSEHPASHLLPIALTLPEEYFGFMDTLAINNEAALKNINYLFYLDHYAKWRQERIEKGLLKFKNVSTTIKKLVKIHKVETFAQVLIDQLEVRIEAHNAESVIARLERGTEILYLQDITTDQFSYPYGGHKYSDKFLKIELSDGRSGWVFRGGVHLKEKIVYAKKWIEVPDTSPEIMRNFKYANFKGKVLQYAVAKDIYWNALKKEGTADGLIAEYLNKAPESEYKKYLVAALNRIISDSTLIIQNDKKVPQPELDKAVVQPTGKSEELLKEITAKAVKKLNKKSNKKDSISSIVSLNPIAEFEHAQVAKIIEIAKPDFSLYEKLTTLRGTASPATLSRPELIINTNPLLREGTSFPFDDQAGAFFQYDISLRSSTTGELKMGKESIDLYLRAGEKLEVAINGNDLYSNTVFTGKGSKANNYLVAAAKEFRKSMLELEVKLRYANPAEFKQFIGVLRSEKFKFLRNYLSSHTLTSDIIKYARADINYWYAYSLMNYPYEHPIFHDQPSPMSVPEDYYDFMDKISVNNSGALPNKHYLYYLQDYLSFQSSKPANKGLNRLELADKFLKGKPLYFYKALQFSLEGKRNVDPDLDQKIDKFIKNCPYQLYGEYVKLAYHEGKGIIEGIDAPGFSLTDIDGNLVSLSDYRGKVVFLDFWATWCVPCIHQLPSHQKLQKQFKGQEVVFLYVSVDRDTGAWQRFVRNKNLKGVHTSAGKNMFNSSIANDYKVSSLPYTLLIDPSGIIVWHHTGGYSVQGVENRIMELIEN